MYRAVIKYIILNIALLAFPMLLSAQSRDIQVIPRVDVHAHVGRIERMPDYIKVREILKEKYNIDLAIIIFFVIVTILSILGLKKLIKTPPRVKK